MARAIDISLTTGLVKDLRGTETFAPAQVDMRNIRLTKAGNTVKRSGYTQKWDTTTEEPVILLIPFGNGYAYTEDGNFYSLGTSVTNIYSGAPVIADSPQWVEDNRKLIVTNGSSPILVDGDSIVNLSNAAPDAKYVAKISSYTIMSGYDPTEFSWSTAGNSRSWPTNNFANLQKTGTLLNMVEYKDRLLFFKERETEIWNFVGGASPFVRYPGGKLLQGLGARNSVVKANDRIYWFSNEGDFYVYENGAARPISSNMRRRLNQLNNLDDMRGYDIRKENHIMWLIPSDGMTIIYDYSNDQWFEDNRWDKSWQSLPFASYMELNRKQYFGSRNCDGLIHEWSEDYLDDNGRTIRVFRKFKVALTQSRHNVRVNRMTLRREGAVATSAVAAPVVAVRWRFDKKQWTNWKHVSLGAVGEHNPYIRLWRLGYGRDLEVEVAHTDDTDFILTDAVIEFEDMNG